MKNFVLGIAFTAAVLVIGGLGYLLLGFAEVRGDLPPSRLESAVMRRAVHASVRREAPEVPNPFPPSDENLIAGGKVYLDECAGCHGTPGKPEEYPGVLFPHRRTSVTSSRRRKPLPPSRGARSALLRP